MLKYYNELLYYAQCMVRNKDVACDIIQEAYVKTLEKSKKITIENERAFLYKVTKNIVIDEVRKNEKMSTLDSVMITTLNEDTLYGIGFESDSDLENWKILKPSGVTGRN